MSVATPNQQQLPTEFLYYRSYSVADLREFIRSRTTLTEKKIRKLNKAKIISRLKKFDTQSAFWRFMDLPPELRVIVFRQVLVVDGQRDGKNHSALLRVSRLIYKESEPVLYCENSFCVEASYPVVKLVVSECLEREWDLPQYRTSKYTLPSFNKTDMLFSLRELSIRLCDLDNVYGSDVNNLYPLDTHRSLTNICLMLSSASRLKALTVTHVPPQDNSWDLRHLTMLLFPVSLLRKTATIRVEGGSPALHAALEESRRKVHARADRALSAYGTLLCRALVLVKALHKTNSGTLPMVRVALDAVLLGNSCIGWRCVRGVIANLHRLETLVGKAEAELAGLFFIRDNVLGIMHPSGRQSTSSSAPPDDLTDITAAHVGLQSLHRGLPTFRHRDLAHHPSTYGSSSIPFASNSPSPFDEPGPAREAEPDDRGFEPDPDVELD